MLSKLYYVVHAYFVGLIKNVPIINVLATFAIVLFLLLLINKGNAEKKKVIRLALCVTIIITYTLLNRKINSISEDVTLKSMFYSYSLLASGQVVEGIMEILCNILLFFPFGYYLRQVLGRKVICIAVILFFAGAIEVVQLYLGVGKFEITDIVNNVIGGTIGLVISEKR